MKTYTTIAIVQQALWLDYSLSNYNNQFGNVDDLQDAIKRTISLLKFTKDDIGDKYIITATADNNDQIHIDIEYTD
jgi:hypothetical protein